MPPKKPRDTKKEVQAVHEPSRLSGRRAFLWSATIGSAALLLTGAALYLTNGQGSGEQQRPRKPEPDKKPYDGAIDQPQLNELYVTLRKSLSDQVMAVKAENKKLLFVLGEDHESKKSVLLEMLIIRALREIDPDSVGSALVSELTPKEFNEVIKTQKEFPNLEIPGNAQTPIPGKTLSAIYALHKLNMRVTPSDHGETVDRIERLKQQGKIDEAEAVLDGTLEFRDKHIAAAINDATPKGGVAVMGLVHMRGVIKALQEAGQDNILAINVSSIEVPATTRPRNMRQALEWATGSKMVNQLKLHGQVQMRLDAMPGMIEQAVQAAPATEKALEDRARNAGGRQPQ